MSWDLPAAAAAVRGRHYPGNRDAHQLSTTLGKKNSTSQICTPHGKEKNQGTTATMTKDQAAVTRALQTSNNFAVHWSLALGRVWPRTVAPQAGQIQSLIEAASLQISSNGPAARRAVTMGAAAASVTGPITCTTRCPHAMHFSFSVVAAAPLPPAATVLPVAALAAGALFLVAPKLFDQR